VGSPTGTGQGTPPRPRPPPPLFATNPDPLSPPATLPQPTFAIQQVLSVDKEPEPEGDELLSTTRATSLVPRTPVSPPRLSLKSDNRDSINWSDSLFSALPSATAFEGFRSSVVPSKSGSTGSTPISRAASTSLSTVELLRTIIPPQQQKTAADLRTDREGTTVPPYLQANPSAGDRGSTGSIVLEEPAIVTRATAITIARAPSMKRSVPARVVVMGGSGTPPVPRVYGLSDLNGSQQSLGSVRGSAGGSPVPSAVRTLAHQSTGSTDTGNSMPNTPQQDQELLQIANKPGSNSDEEDDSRYTIRVDDARAEQILAAVREAKSSEGRPISTASVATVRDGPYTNGTSRIPEPVRDSVAEDDLLESYLDSNEDDDGESDYDDGVLDGPNLSPDKHPALAIPPLSTNGPECSALCRDEISPASGMSPGDSFIAGDGPGTPMMNSALPETPSPFLTSPSSDILSKLQQQQQSVAPLNLVGKKARAASNGMSRVTVSKPPLHEDVPPVLTSLASEIQAADPRAMFANLVEIAEGESGSVYAAEAIFQSPVPGPPGSNRGNVVAVKKVSVVTAAPKIDSVRHEMDILKNVQHENILGYHSLYFAEDALWLRMELMDRSCADLLALYEGGLVVEEKHVASVTRDVGGVICAG
jgi:Protein kinase domain